MKVTNKKSNRWYIENLFKIRNKRGQIVPFISNTVQNIYWKKGGRKNIWLKPRQKGMTKIIDADQLMDCIRKKTNAVVISHERDSTKRLFKAIQFYLDNLEVKPATEINNAREISFPKRDSLYFIGTAGQKAFGRGDTIDRLHLSEAAFYPNLARIIDGAGEAAEYGRIDIESTPNGRGNKFYEMYKAAKEGKSPYNAIFIPWYIDNEYSSDSLTEAEKEGLSPAVQEIFNTPEEEIVLTEDEKNLKEKAKRDFDIDLTIGQIKWRRYKIWDRGDKFFQEYPEDDETCFLRSGRPVFSQVKLDRGLSLPLEQIKEGSEKAKELKGRNLFGGVDGAEGVRDGDNHCFAVIDLTPDTPNAVLYEYTSNEPLEVFDKKVCEIVNKFDIITKVEKNGVGLAHVENFRKMGMRFTPYTTTGTNRPVMISNLEAAYRKQELIETYPQAKTEALNMYYDKNNRPSHPEGHHDDRVFARAIALQASKGARPRISWL